MKRIFPLICFISLFLSCRTETDKGCHPLQGNNDFDIDSINIILMQEGIDFVIRENRSDFFHDFCSDSDNLYYDTLLVDHSAVYHLLSLLGELNISDTLSYLSSQISFEIKDNGKEISFSENSMDNRGLLQIYHKASVEFVWLSYNEIEREKYRYEMSDSIEHFLSKIRSQKWKL